MYTSRSKDQHLLHYTGSCINIFHAAGTCADDRSKNLQKVSKMLKLLNLMTIFGITMEIAFK